MADAKYPSDLVTQLLPGEQIEYFSYISQQGGCAQMGPRQEHWLALTDRRAIYRAMVRDIEKKRAVQMDGMIPLAKVSFIEVTQATQSGCSTSKTFELKIGSSGSHVVIPIPTREKGLEIRQMYSTIAERHNWGRSER